MKKFFVVLFLSIFLYSNEPYYFCTATNSSFYKPLLTLIGGIHKYHFDNLGEIAVFDLGLSRDEIFQLEKMQKVVVLQVEKKNPKILTPVMTRKEGKPVPGWYSWKPVCIKQSLDRYPDVLWIDAGTVLFLPIDHLFTYMRKQGYFFHNGTDHSFTSQCTLYVKEKYGLYLEENDWILKEEIFGLEAGIMGITRKIYDSFVVPAYEIAGDIKSFIDDGTTKDGFGFARHDQTIFSMLALLNHFTILQHRKTPLDLMYLGEEKLPFHIASCPEFRTKYTNLSCLRKKSGVYNYRSYILYKN